LFIFTIVLGVVITGWAQPKPNFSGTWTLDTDKSDPPPQGPGGPGGGGSPPVTIVQTAADIKIGGVTYTLDASTHTIQLPVPDGTTQTAVATAKWDGAKLVTSITQYSGMGLSTTTETRTLSADGKEMTVETISQMPVMDVEMKRKTVYTKN